MAWACDRIQQVRYDRHHLAYFWDSFSYCYLEIQGNEFALFSSWLWMWLCNGGTCKTASAILPPWRTSLRSPISILIMRYGRDGRICYTRINRLASRPANHFLLAIAPNFCITQRNVFTEARVVLMASSFLQLKSSIGEETVSCAL